MANAKGIENEVTRLADIELETAVEKWGLNHSNHESFAVIREEIDETESALQAVEYLAGRVWELTKQNATPNALREVYNNLYKESINLACEVIQVAAMARKGILSNIEIYREDNKQNALDCAKCEDGISAACVVDGCKYKERGGEL